MTARLSNRWLAAIVVVLVLVGVAVRSPAAFFTLILDSFPVVMVIVPASLVGLWLVPIFRLGDMPFRWHLLLGSALGLGFQSNAVLVLGAMGWLHRPLWIGVLAACTAAGVLRLRSLSTETRSEPGKRGPTARGPNHLRLLWLAVIPFFVLSLVAATNAPGFVWSEEGYGYDVLEYHLQMPKEYVHAGRITYAPHNVYANFPANVEMLYLLAMILLGEDMDAGTTANLIHCVLGFLAIFAVWVVARDSSRNAGTVSAVCLASTGWLPYLSGLAYVEHGLLFFGVTATGCLVRAMAAPGEGDAAVASRRRGWLLVTGLIAGFACGCKYTAVPMIAGPLVLAALLGHGRAAIRTRRAGVVLVGCLAGFAPWLLKNQLATGNPVYPLANSVFHAQPDGIGSVETARWADAHRPAMAADSSDGGFAEGVTARVGTAMGALWQHVLWDPYHRFGPLIMLMALAAIVARKLNVVDAALIVMLLVQLAVWMLATHLYARFAVVFLVPLSLLAGRAALIDGESSRNSAAPRIPGIPRISHVRRMATATLLAGMLWNIVAAARLHADESPGGLPASLIYHGNVPGYEYLASVNGDLPPGSKVLVIGDARGFYYRPPADCFTVFNRNPFAEFVEGGADAAGIIRWLQDRGYTHIVVHWSEVRRLSRTYGFTSAITEELFQNLIDNGELTTVYQSQAPNRVAIFRVPSRP